MKQQGEGTAVYTTLYKNRYINHSRVTIRVFFSISRVSDEQGAGVDRVNVSLCCIFLSVLGRIV